MTVETAPEAKPLEGMRAALVVPSYGNTDSQCAKDVRVSMMNAAVKGLEWVGDISPDRMGYAAARNTATQQFIEAGPDFADGIMWIDNDIRCSPASISRLIYQAKRLKADFISGVYHHRGGKYKPVFYIFKEAKKGEPRGRFYSVEDYPEDTLAPADACGFGFVWTSSKLIDAIARHPDFNERGGWFPDNRDSGGFGEDLSFCYQAMRCGIQLYVDTGIQLGHMGDPEVITREQHLKALAEKEKQGIPEVRGPKGWGL
jgi:hypothetical protein